MCHHSPDNYTTKLTLMAFCLHIKSHRQGKCLPLFGYNKRTRDDIYIRYSVLSNNQTDTEPRHRMRRTNDRYQRCGQTDCCRLPSTEIHLMRWLYRSICYEAILPALCCTTRIQFTSTLDDDCSMQRTISSNGRNATNLVERYFHVEILNTLSRTYAMQIGKFMNECFSFRSI